MPLNRRAQITGTIISCLAILQFFTYLIFGLIGVSGEGQLLLALGIALVVAAGLGIFVFRRYRKAGQPEELDYLNIGTQRYLLGLFMIFYGVPKLLGNFFDYQLFALDSRLTDVSEFELAWYYFGKNRWQELFAGIMEFIPGILLLRRRTYYIAALVLLPVTSQVFILNLFFKIGGITFPAATILLACNAYILYSQKEQIIRFFRSLDFSVHPRLGTVAAALVRIGKWGVIGLGALIVFNNVSKVVFKSPYRKKYQKLVGKYTLESMNRNGAAVSPAADSSCYKDLYIEKQSRWNILRSGNGKTDAYVLGINTRNDSITIAINKGGIGDAPDIIDSATALKGVYQLAGDVLTISGIQSKDTVQLRYRRQKLAPKQWFW